MERPLGQKQRRVTVPTIDGPYYSRIYVFDTTLQDLGNYFRKLFIIRTIVTRIKFSRDYERSVIDQWNVRPSNDVITPILSELMRPYLFNGNREFLRSKLVSTPETPIHGNKETNRRKPYVGFWGTGLNDLSRNFWFEKEEWSS